MRRSILVVSGLVLALCVAQTLAAQVPTPPPGTRVRVSILDVRSKPLIGVVDSVRADAIVLQMGPETRMTVAISQVSQVQVSRGRRRPMWSKTAPLWLTGSAAGVGAILSNATYEPGDFFSREESAALAAIGLGTLGLLVGTGLAIAVKEEQWESVLDVRSSPRTPAAPSLYVTPASRGITLGMRAAF